MRRTELQDEVQLIEELQRTSFFVRRQWPDEGNGRSDGRCGFLEECRQGLDRITVLDSFDVHDIRGIEQLGPVDDEGKLRLRLHDLLDTRGRLAIPVRSGE